MATHVDAAGLGDQADLGDEAAAQSLVVLDGFEAVVLAVGEETYEVARVDAEARLEGRDLDDWPILATCSGAT